LVEMREPGTVEIWLNRPERLNALSVEMVTTLTKVVRGSVGSGVRALVLRGKGRGFCAGADLKERKTMAQVERYAHNRAIYAAVEALAAVPVPTVAVINGAAMGGGLELTLACDIRIAAENAQLGLTEARIGAMPGGGGTQRLPRLIGLSRALDLIYTGRTISGREAANIGLVNTCVAEEGLDAAVTGYMDVLASRSPTAARAVKKVVYEGLELPIAEGLERERKAFSAILRSADYEEGLTAFAEKRPPRFSR
jgi:enoyl-CoA hydratase/carnithine racemase